uniref:Transcription initiation factor TFIID subunit 8 n=1 Tax=Phallusia mammillata TaxID=59560 RepID=A0A6F9DUE7_9ASCI|nr:transcription initiation factor TFIID subunit 8-like [Phallusia mammillata]
MAAEGISVEGSYRRALTMSIAALCVETGFDVAQDNVLETLTEMIQSYITEVGNSTRAFYEHSGRTLPTGRDMMCALADLGFPNKQLLQYLKRPRRVNMGQIPKTAEPSSPPVLEIGKRKNFPNYVSDSYNYPILPDPHTYVRTTTGQKPEKDYAILRERVSVQKRDVERALTRFVAKTGNSHALLPDDKNSFPLIAARPSTNPYLAALIPSEHETVKLYENHSQDEQEESTEKESETPKSKNRKMKRHRAGNDVESSPSLGGAQTKQTPPIPVEPPSANKTPEVIHNPYLRPVKKPKLKKKR